MIGNVEGKTVIITDDMIDTGGTIVSGVKALKQKGCNEDIYVVATHAIFSGPAVERMKQANFKEVIVSDSFPVPEEKRFDGLTILSAAELLGEAVRRNYDNKSISSLFD
jgi:ribose-phosphate pyrophosphokinase